MSVGIILVISVSRRNVVQSRNSVYAIYVDVKNHKFLFNYMFNACENHALRYAVCTEEPAGQINA